MSTSKIVKSLIHSHTLFTDSKQQLLNHPKILTYLYHRPAFKHHIPDDKRIIKLNSLDRTVIEGHLLVMTEATDRYRLAILSAEHKLSLENIPFLAFAPDDHFVVRTVGRLESKLKCEINLYYMWTFNTIVYDFVGIVIKNGQMKIFAIELTDANAKSDYMLRQMNVHLLRLNVKSKTAVATFIKRVIENSTYVYNAKATKQICSDTFYTDYQQMHLLQIKSSEEDSAESDSDNSDSEVELISSVAHDKAHVISDSAFKRLTRSKIYFTKR